MPIGSWTFRRTQDEANSEASKLPDTLSVLPSLYQFLTLFFALPLKRYLRYSLSLVYLSIYALTNILPCDILRPGKITPMLTVTKS